MPYSYTINDTITLHTTVHYGASKSGGSKPVSLSEPISITVTVDDTAFRNAVDNCDVRISSVNGNLVESIRQQTEAKKASARKISKSVLDGFYNYAASDFRQQMVQLENVVKSTLPKLQTYFEQLRDLRKRMESDYNLISKRYLGIIQTFDDELEREMHRLYSPVFELHDDCQTKLLVESRTDALSASIGFEDISTVQTMMVQAKLKSTFHEVMKKLAATLSNRRSLDKLIERVAENKTVSGETEYLPLVYFEHEEASGDVGDVILTSSIDFATRDKLAQRVKECMIATGTEVDNSDRDDELLDMNFMARLSSLGDERKAKEMLRLYEEYKKRRRT